MVFPGASLQFLPLIISAKYSLKGNDKISLATGALYMTMPGVSGDFQGTGISFGTATFGNKFTHYSASLGFGFINYGSGWYFSKKPLLVLAGNVRINNSIAWVSELWKPPYINLENSPFMTSIRFIGRKISVDVGFLSTLSAPLLLPWPLINFTYYMQ